MMNKSSVRAILLTALVISSAGACTTVPAVAEIKPPEQFTTFCAPCHGPAGAGNGPAAAVMDPKPRNFTDGKLMNARTDAQLINVIKNGSAAEKLSPQMIGYSSMLNDQEIKDIVAFIRSLAVPKYQPKK